jgi:hypothetical protein
LISSSIHLFFKTGYLLRLNRNPHIFVNYELRYALICFSDCVNYITVRDITSWSPALVDKLKKANRSVLYQLYCTVHLTFCISVSNSESGSGFRRAKMNHKNRKKFRKFMLNFWPSNLWIRIGIQPTMPDPDPESMNPGSEILFFIVHTVPLVKIDAGLLPSPLLFFDDP